MSKELGLLQVSAGLNSVWALTKDGQVIHNCRRAFTHHEIIVDLMYFNFILHLQLNGHIDGVRLEVYEKIMWITLWCNNCISFVAIDLLSVCWVLGLKGSATYLETLSVFVGRALKPYCYRLILYELECSQCMYS